ncbi:MAG: electron transfer flavoprotein subunit alpha [Desulfobacterales bacterium]|nr:electron transfer flavoprotein subunit alpha [Desulfobacterales bacterium]
MLIRDKKKCNGCKICETACPFGAIHVIDQIAEINDSCTLCGACVSICPTDALLIERKKPSLEELAGYSGIFVWSECEVQNRQLVPKKVVYELLCQARELAGKLNQPVAVVALGDDRLSNLDPLIGHGADRVLCCKHALLKTYATDSFTNVIAAVIAKEKPSVFLFGATPNGRDLAPRIAARLHLGLTADCTGLDIDSQGQLVQTRPAFGGNIMASIISPYTRPQMATVRPNVFSMRPPDMSRTGKVENVPVTLSRAGIRTKIVEEINLGGEIPARIEDARIIVSAGRGCRNQENLGLVRQLAAELGGAMAGSRAIVELDWIPHTLQVGQSGTTVGPELYIAVGISGAVQHLVGMSASKTIIAINCDPDAPIFKVADLGIVGDALEILPKLIRKVREAKKPNATG